MGVILGKNMGVVLVLMGIFVAGCHGGRDRFRVYADNPLELMLDPHFAEHENQARDMERAYLHKKITYAEYLEAKKELEAKYSDEVRKREAILYQDGS
jgi:hypothetical protein